MAFDTRFCNANTQDSGLLKYCTTKRVFFTCLYAVEISWINIGCKLVSVFVKNFQTKSNLRKETISLSTDLF